MENEIAKVATALIGLAVLSVVLSPKATTTKVISASSSAGANLLSAATAPVTGASAQIQTGGNEYFGS